MDACLFMIKNASLCLSNAFLALSGLFIGFNNEVDYQKTHDDLVA